MVEKWQATLGDVEDTTVNPNALFGCTFANIFLGAWVVGHALYGLFGLTTHKDQAKNMTNVDDGNQLCINPCVEL